MLFQVLYGYIMVRLNFSWFPKAYANKIALIIYLKRTVLKVKCNVMHNVSEEQLTAVYAPRDYKYEHTCKENYLKISN